MTWTPSTQWKVHLSPLVPGAIESTLTAVDLAVVDEVTSKVFTWANDLGIIDTEKTVRGLCLNSILKDKMTNVGVVKANYTATKTSMGETVVNLNTPFDAYANTDSDLADDAGFR